MKITKLISVITLFCLLSACGGVGKFFIERAINKIDSDVANRLEEFATLTPEQEAHAEAIAELFQARVKQEILPTVADLIEQVAVDVETKGRLTQDHYDKIVGFFYQPLPMSENAQLINDVARFFYKMTPEQDIEVRERLIINNQERNEKREKRDLDDQRDAIAKTLRTVFRGMGVARSRSEVNESRDILQGRVDLNQQTENFYTRINQLFLDLTENKGDSLEDFTARYKDAWQQFEAGPQSDYPELFKANADNGLAAINNLFESLNQEERIKAASVIREYEQFFLELAAK